MPESGGNTLQFMKHTNQFGIVGGLVDEIVKIEFTLHQLFQVFMILFFQFADPG